MKTEQEEPPSMAKALSLRAGVVAGVKRVGVELDIGWRTVLVVAGSALLVGGLLLAKTLNDRHYARTGPGELRGAHLLTLADRRPVLVVSSNVYISHAGRYGGEHWSQVRLEVIDPVEGRELARTLVEHPTECIGAGQGAMWCDTSLVSGSTLELRDVATLAVLKTHAQLLANAPPLARTSTAQVDPLTGFAWLPTSDGRYWHLDAATLSGGIDNTEPEHTDIRGSLSPLAGGIHSRIGGLYFSGGPRKTLVASDGRGTVREVTQQAFLHPSFLVDTDGPMTGSPAPLLIDDGGVAFIVHEDSVDHDTAQVSISAQGLDGGLRWSTALGHVEVKGAWLLGERLVLAVGAHEQGEVLVLGTGDGKLLWKHGI